MNVTSVFHVLSSSDDCLVFNINSTVGDIDQIMSVLNISVSGGEEAVVRSLYLMGRKLEVRYRK